jgi:hypothetical protein
MNEQQSCNVKFNELLNLFVHLVDAEKVKK